MAEWLKSCGIKHVVMQSTGVYWIAVYDVLEKAGFEICLSNARDTKNLPGRKTDVQESQWPMKLHTYGLLRNSFRPTEEIRTVRTIRRLRNRHVQEAAREIQHMQKALTTMNVQLSNAISDVSGVTGLAIIRAILQGEWDPFQLAKLKDYRIQASEEEIARSLEGNWQKDVLFELQQAVEAYDFCQKQIGDCDQQLQKYLAALPDRTIPRPRKPGPTVTSGELTRICGINLKSIDGVDVMTIATFISELGTDMTRWKDEDHLASCLKLSPRWPVSGGKVIKKQERLKVKNRAAEALRMAASSLFHSDSLNSLHQKSSTYEQFLESRGSVTH